VSERAERSGAERGGTRHILNDNQLVSLWRQRLIAKQCDDYVASVCDGYTKGKFHKLLTESKCCKGRLLHYFPSDEVEKKIGKTGSIISDNDFSDWCGWHNDHGSLTGLVPAIYSNASGEIVPNPDPDSGLYIRSRSGKLVKVVLPKVDNCISFQIGETSQIHTGGILQVSGATFSPSEPATQYTSY